MNAEIIKEAEIEEMIFNVKGDKASEINLQTTPSIVMIGNPMDWCEGKIPTLRKIIKNPEYNVEFYIY